MSGDRSPTQRPKPSNYEPMSPSDQQAKDTQDEQRRRTQAENKIHELEERIDELEARRKQLREAANIAEEILEAKLAKKAAYDTTSSNKERKGWPTHELEQLMATVENALDGAEDGQDE